MNLLRFEENDIDADEDENNEREIKSKRKKRKKIQGVLESVSTVEMCNH